MRRRPLLVLPALAVTAGALVLLSLNGDPGRRDNKDDEALPSVAEATALLHEQVDRLRAKPTRDDYCQGNFMCPNAWLHAGGDAAVPTGTPHVLGTWVSRQQRVLTVCGKDGRGRPYQSDFVAERVKGVLQAPFIVFWGDLIYEGFRPDDGSPVIVTGDPSYVPRGESNPPECG